MARRAQRSDGIEGLEGLDETAESESIGGVGDAIEPGEGDDPDGNGSSTATESEDAAESSAFVLDAVDVPAARPTRSRGRPRKSAAANIPRKRDVDSAAKPTTRTTPKNDAKAMARAVIGAADAVVISTLGADKIFSTFERGLIEPSLASILESMPVSAIARYGSILNPVMLAAGLGMWAFRVMPQQSKPKVARNAPAVSNGQASTGQTPPGATEAATVPDAPVYRNGLDLEFLQTVRQVGADI